MDKSKFNYKKEWQKFAYGLCIILSVFAAIQWYIESDYFLYFLISSGLILLVGIALPILIKPIFIFFSYLSTVLGWIMTRIILIFLYYLVFTSIGLISRIFGKRFLNTDFNKSQNSYWIDREENDQAFIFYERQF